MQICRRWIVWVGAVCLWVSTSAWAGENLVISFMVSSGNQRTFWDTEVIQKFKLANPDVQVTQFVRGQEAYKAGFSQMLQNEAVDVAFWFAGERLSQVVESTVAATSIRSKIYALPLSYNGWDSLCPIR